MKIIKRYRGPRQTGHVQQSCTFGRTFFQHILREIFNSGVHPEEGVGIFNLPFKPACTDKRIDLVLALSWATLFESPRPIE